MISAVDVRRAANEVYVIARFLFAWEPAHAEGQMAYMRASEADRDRLREFGDLHGRYLQLGSWFIHIRENGDAQSMPTLPEEVPATEVIDITPKGGSQTPLQDRLREIASTALSFAPDPNWMLLAQAIDEMLAACSPDNNQRWFSEIKHKALTGPLGLIGRGEPTEVFRLAKGFLEELELLLPEMRNGPSADGRLVGAILGFRALTVGAADAAESLPEEMKSLVDSISYIATPGRASMDTTIQWLSQRMIRKGHAQLVREVAEKLKAHGDELIDEALDGEPDSFYPPLYASVAYELACFFIATAATEVVEDPAEVRRWRKLTDDVEERAVRATNSLGFAVRNLDGTAASKQLLLIRQTREERGEAAAKLEAEDLILQLFYPRCMLPILLDKRPIPPPMRQ